MFCGNCGFENDDNANFCKKCGNSLNNFNNTPQSDSYIEDTGDNSSSEKKNLIIISITILIILAIISGTIIFITNNNVDTGSSENQNSAAPTTNRGLTVNTVSYYQDGNPNTGLTATINVGKEHTGENIDIKMTYSRDGSNLNNPSSFEKYNVDNDGNVIVTEYSAIPRYPDYCLIEIRYNNNDYKFGVEMGKYKGTQTNVPRLVE